LQGSGVVTMSETQAFDVVVIGAGPAGVGAAVAAAQLGKTVAVAEKNVADGRAALHTGTVPRQTLRETAPALAGLRSRGRYGVDLSMRRQCTGADLLRHEHAVMGTERTRWSGFLGQYGVTMVPGAARFLDSHTIAIAGPAGERVLRAGVVIIAIGS